MRKYLYQKKFFERLSMLFKILNTIKTDLISTRCFLKKNMCETMTLALQHPLREKDG